MLFQLWKLACFTTNPVSGAQTVAEYHSRKHLLHCTRGLKGFINAAEAEVGNCWMFILEQPTGMYQPSFSGVAKEDGKGRGKALFSRNDILSWELIAIMQRKMLLGTLHLYIKNKIISGPFILFLRRKFRFKVNQKNSWCFNVYGSSQCRYQLSLPNHVLDKNPSHP